MYKLYIYCEPHIKIQSSVIISHKIISLKIKDYYVIIYFTKYYVEMTHNYTNMVFTPELLVIFTKKKVHKLNQKYILRNSTTIIHSLNHLLSLFSFDRRV